MLSWWHTGDERDAHQHAEAAASVFYTHALRRRRFRRVGRLLLATALFPAQTHTLDHEKYCESESFARNQDNCLLFFDLVLSFLKLWYINTIYFNCSKQVHYSDYILDERITHMLIDARVRTETAIDKNIRFIEWCLKMSLTFSSAESAALHCNPILIWL